MSSSPDSASKTRTPGSRHVADAEKELTRWPVARDRIGERLGRVRYRAQATTEIERLESSREEEVVRGQDVAAGSGAQREAPEVASQRGFAHGEAERDEGIGVDDVDAAVQRAVGADLGHVEAPAAGVDAHPADGVRAGQGGWPVHRMPPGSVSRTVSVATTSITARYDGDTGV